MERNIFPAKNCHSCEIKNKNKNQTHSCCSIRGKMKKSATKHVVLNLRSSFCDTHLNRGPVGGPDTRTRL